MNAIGIMKKIKYLILCLLGLSLGLTSCNHKSETLYHSLPIEKEYEPMEFVFDRNEISKEELNEMPNLKLVINSQEDFPDENLMGLKDIKESDIDFQKYTLLLVYSKVPGVVGGYTYSYAKDFENDTIIFSITYRLDQDLRDKTEKENLFTYCRNAILVSKIPENTEVEFRLSM